MAKNDQELLRIPAMRSGYLILTGLIALGLAGLAWAGAPLRVVLILFPILSFFVLVHPTWVVVVYPNRIAIRKELFLPIAIQKWEYSFENLLAIGYNAKTGHQTAMEAVGFFLPIPVPASFHDKIVIVLRTEGGNVIHKEIKADLPEAAMARVCYRVNSILPNQDPAEKS